MEEASRSLQHSNQQNNGHGNTSLGPPKSVFLTPPEPQSHLPPSLSQPQAPSGPLAQPLNLTPTANGQLLVGSHLIPAHPHPLPMGLHGLGGLPHGLTGLTPQSTPSGEKFESSVSQQQSQGSCKRPTFLDEARFMQQLAVNHANIKMTSQGGSN